jgi:hypothetical protein
MLQTKQGIVSPSVKMMNYIVLYNFLHPYDTKNCGCIQNKNQKYVVGSDSPSIRQSQQYRVSFLCRTPVSGTTQFGNGYLGQPVKVNYLGRGEGQSGGSGAPPLNRF